MRIPGTYTTIVLVMLAIALTGCEERVCRETECVPMKKCPPDGTDTNADIQPDAKKIPDVMTDLEGRIAGRDYPSVFQAWCEIENKPEEDELTRLARHDLVFTSIESLYKLKWAVPLSAPHIGLATTIDGRGMAAARAIKEKLEQKNPHQIRLADIFYKEGEPGYLPPDSPMWLRDAYGKKIIGWGEDTNRNGRIDKGDTIYTHLIDFRRADLQELIIAKADALKRSGLVDGIMLDWWREDSVVAQDFNTSKAHMTLDEQAVARNAILTGIRKRVGEDFLILANSNNSLIPASASHVNGTFLESFKPAPSSGYTREEVCAMENALVWSEANLREPRINCMEGWREVTNLYGNKATRIAERNNPANMRWMRLVTAQTLIMSNGYTLFSDDNRMPSWDHLHNWYDLWDLDFGRPVSKTNRTYHGVKGLFIREFDNGWVIYNRSGRSQTIDFEVPVFTVGGEMGLSHEVADLDGGFFLKR